MPAERNETCPTTQRFAVFRDPKNPPDSWRSWSAYTRDFNTAWPSFVGFYEGCGVTRRERKADAIKRARIDAMAKHDAAPTPAPREEKCASCSHPGHIGACTRRMGGTAYACGCLRTTLPTTKNPAPRDATPTDGEWVPAAQRERERAVIEAAYLDAIACPSWQTITALRDAALRRGERNENGG